MWPESVGENSWGLREYYVDFLYLSTIIFPHLYFPLKEMYCFLFEATPKFMLCFSSHCKIFFYKNKNIGGIHFIFFFYCFCHKLLKFRYSPFQWKRNSAGDKPRLPLSMTRVSHLSITRLACNCGSICSLGWISSHPIGSCTLQGQVNKQFLQPQISPYAIMLPGY